MSMRRGLMFPEGGYVSINSVGKTKLRASTKSKGEKRVSDSDFPKEHAEGDCSFALRSCFSWSLMVLQIKCNEYICNNINTYCYHSVAKISIIAVFVTITEIIIIIMIGDYQVRMRKEFP